MNDLINKKVVTSKYENEMKVLACKYILLKENINKMLKMGYVMSENKLIIYIYALLSADFVCFK